MFRVVFPTNEKLSYISTVDTTYDDAKYLTILNLRGQNITDVEIVDNPYINSKDTIEKISKENGYAILFSPEGCSLPVEKLHEEGISVYKTSNKKTILQIYSDFVQDKLEKIA